MEKLMTYENLWYYAYSNDKEITGKIRGIAIEFYGLYNQQQLTASPGVLTDFLADALGDLYIQKSHEFAKKGIIYIVPFCNPWNWMNQHTVKYVDEIVEVIVKHYNIENPRTVHMGMSMGGMNSLAYSRLAKITPVGCVAACPVCDFVYHYYEREDLPRTIWSAFGYYEGTMKDALLSVSPIHNVGDMPKIPYLIFQGSADAMVSKEHHADKFVPVMKENGFDITYHVLEDYGHCEFPQDKLDEYFNFADKVLE